MTWDFLQISGRRSEPSSLSFFPYSELFSSTDNVKGLRVRMISDRKNERRSVKQKGKGMRWKSLIALIVSTLFVTGCANTVTSFESFCNLTETHSFSDEVIDKMSREELVRELTHNELRERYCD